MKVRLRSLGWSAVALVLALTATPAVTLEYPTRPVTLIVSHKPGGPSDVIGRLLAKVMAPVMRQPLVIENRPGAAGNIAGEQVAQADADGYTLLMGSTNILATNPARKKDIGFDPQLDFAPITLLGTQANALVVNPALPANTLAQLIELAKAKPNVVTFASAGHGSASHLAGELFKMQAKVSLVHVPYQKPGSALQDVIGGHVQMMFAPAAMVANHVRAGRLRPIGLATEKPSAFLPGVPTLTELGLPGFDATTWYGLVAPAGTSKEIIDMLYHSTATALENPESRQAMSRFGLDVVANSPREFDAYMKTQIPKWSMIVNSIANSTH